MTSAERVMAAFTGEQTDRPPFTLTLSLYGARLIDAPLDRYYADPALYAEGQARVAELIAPDIIFAPFVLPREAEAFGAELAVHATGPPTVRRHPFRSPRDAASLAPPPIDRTPSLSYLCESVRRLGDRFGGSVPLVGILTAPVDLPAMLMGLEGWLETLLFEPELAERVLAATTEHFVAMAEALAAAGAGCIAIPLMLCNPRLVTPAVISRLIVPPLERAFARVGLPLIIHHGGNPAAPLLPLVAGLPHVAGFAIGPGDSFAEARRIVGEKPVLLGNLNGAVLNRIPPDRARARAGEILDDRCDDRHFVLASSSADVPLDTPLETLLAIRDEVAGRGASTIRGAALGAEAVVVSCGIFRSELDALEQAGKFPWPVRYLDSMLHMHPDLLEQNLTTLVESLPGRPIVLLFGDCQARMDQLAARPGVRRVEGHNCCEIILGGEEYRRMRREGVFFLLPEWSARWKEAFRDELGFVTSESARLFMQEMHRRIVYLDTGVMPVPTETLEEIGSYFGLPVEVMAVGPHRLADAVARALEDGDG